MNGWKPILQVLGALLGLVLYFSERPSSPGEPPADSGRTPPTDRGFASWHGAGRPTYGTRTTVTTRIFVPAGAQLLIGSLDTRGSDHNIHVCFTDAMDGAEESVSNSTTDIDIARIELKQFAPARGLPAFTAPVFSEYVSEPTDAITADSAETKFTRRFQTPYFTSLETLNQYIEGYLIRESAQIRVFADERLTNLSPGSEQMRADLAKRVVSIADSGLLEHVATRLGPIHDVDQDGALTILITSLSDPTLRPQYPITGCVRGSDFLEEGPFGGDLIYLDQRISRKADADLAAVLAHEFTHAAVFSLLRKSASGGRTMPLWLNEAIAHSIELEVGPASSNLIPRAREYLRSPNLYPIVSPPFQLTGGRPRGPARVAGCSFAMTCLSSFDHAPLEQLVVTEGSGIERIEHLTQSRFAELFRTWCVRLARFEHLLKPMSAEHSQTEITVYGTAFCVFEGPRDDTVVEITAPPEALLQLTVAQ